MKKILLAALFRSGGGVGFEVQTLDYVQKNGTVCSALSCLSFYHTVFTAFYSDPILPPPRLLGLAHVDDRHWSDGLAFESHLVNGDCSDSSQISSCQSYGLALAAVYSFGYTIISPTYAEIPANVCLKLELTDTISNTSLDLGCPGLGLLPNLSSRERTGTALNTFSSAVTWLNDTLNAHIVFTVAPSSPLTAFAGVIEYSLDCGVTWSSKASRTFFESHIDILNSTFYQAWQADIELLLPKTAPSVFCFKVSLSDTFGPPQDPISLVTPNSSPVPGANCLSVSQTPVPFHWPLGYCSNCADPATLCRRDTAHSQLTPSFFLR